ncbi:MAG TPA: hypothetical protein PKW82_10145, partial [Spirochaetales bacterium]|nr:hypothetical protein [Spirochaetales bacterium]
MHPERDGLERVLQVGVDGQPEVGAVDDAAGTARFGGRAQLPVIAALYARKPAVLVAHEADH